MSRVRQEDVDKALRDIKSTLYAIENVNSDIGEVADDIARMLGDAEEIRILEASVSCRRCGCDGSKYPYPPLRYRSRHFYCEACYAAYF